MARGKRTCSVSIQPPHLCVFFYLQAYFFKHRGVKQDYDSSLICIFFSTVSNNMNRLINFSKLVFMQSDSNIALQTQALCRNNSVGGSNWSQGWKTLLSFAHLSFFWNSKFNLCNFAETAHQHVRKIFMNVNYVIWLYSEKDDVFFNVFQLLLSLREYFL